MASGPPGSMPAPLPAGEPPPPSSDPSWEGDRMFNIYIYDYCNKRGFRNTARELLAEAEIPPDSAPPINARQGLLFEWWSVFWVLFTAKSNGTGTDDAIVYTQHQIQQQHIRQHNAQPMRQQPTAMTRFMNGAQRPQTSMPPSGQMPNGVGPASLPGNPGSMQNGTQGPMPFPMGQANGIPMPSGGPPGQPGNFSQLLPGQQRPGGPPRQNGAAPPFQSPTMSHSPHIAGGNPGSGPQHQQAPMSQLGGPPNHLANLSRPMHPSNQSMGSAPPTQTPPFPVGRSPSRSGTPGQGGMLQRSPSLVARQTPTNSQEAALSNELARMPTEAVTAVKQSLGLADKDLHLLGFQDKQRILDGLRQQRGMKLGPAGPSNVQGMAPPGQLRRPGQHPQTMQQTPQQQQQQQMQQQQMQLQQQQQQQQMQRIKRSSTSPGEEHGTLPNNESSSPDRDRKRQRRTPPLMEQTPSMGPGPGYPHPPQQQQGIPGGPQAMTNGMMRPGSMQGAPMNNFPSHNVPPNMGNAGMGLPMGAPGNAMSPGMVSGQGNHMMLASAYRQSMAATTKNLLAAAAPGGSDQGFHPVQGQPPQFTGPQNNRVGQNLAQSKAMGGGMAPPASPAMGGPMKDQKDVKPIINNNIPEGSPHNAPAAPGQGGPSSNPTGSAHGTAPPTPNTINSSITQSPAPNGTPSVPPAANPASQPQQPISDLTSGFMSADFMQSMSALEDLDPSMFRTDFEQDFREWFDPSPSGVDMK